MSSALHASPASFPSLPEDYATLCREVWLPRPIHDRTEHEAALSAIEPLWGHEENMNADQADWFQLVADLIADYEDAHEPAPQALPWSQRLSGLLAEHGMTAADLGRFLGLDPSMGSKILKGDRKLTAAHIKRLSRHFTLPAEFFLAP
jgi:antitoxin component HigA of HigAB toxin-antitoxin module